MVQLPSGIKTPIARIYVTSRERRKRSKKYVIDVDVIECYTMSQVNANMDHYLKILNAPGYNKSLLDVQLELILE